MAELERLSDGSYVRHADKTESGTEERVWYSAEDPTASLWSLVRSLRTRQTYRHQADDLALRLYSDMRYVGYTSASGSAVVDDVLESRVGENVIRAITRALNSKLARRRSRPYIVTNDANFSQRMTAESLEKWLIGKLRDQHADEEKFPLFRLHALTFGTGCIRTYHTPERGACMEVIPTNEIIVDEGEAKYGDPPNIYFMRTASINQLKFDYSDKLDVIKQSTTGPSAFDGWGTSTAAWDRDQSSDLTPLIEAYHRPSGPGASDGRHVIASTGGILLDEPWKRDHFPLVWMRGELRPMGFWGIGVPEDLAQTQIEITGNAIARREVIDLLANPYWLVERGMKVGKAAISQLIGRVMEWTSTGSGQKPELVVQPAVPPDLWTQGEALKKTAFETKGVSQLSAQMLKPAGLNSGKALRAYNEMESELLADLMNEYEYALLKVCELLIEEQIELSEELKAAKERGEEIDEYATKVTYVGDGEIERIDWNDIDLKDDLDNYVIEILPASAMATTLSARIEDVMDMKDLGVLSDAEEVWEYLQMPDRRRLQRKKSSPRRLLERIVEIRIVKRGEDVQPEPTWDLAGAIDMAFSAIKELELYEDAPEDRLELLRMFIVKCNALIEIQAADQLAAEGMQNDLSGDPSGADGGPVAPDAALPAEPLDPFGLPEVPPEGGGFPVGPGAAIPAF
jgi:hypothetical protein